MSLMKSLLAGSALAVLSTGAALADPALIYDLGGKFDKSFNEAGFMGAQRWVEETGGTYRELEMQSEAQREQALRRLAESGSNPIVMVGFAFGDVLTKWRAITRTPNSPSSTWWSRRRTCSRSSSPRKRAAIWQA